MPLTLEQKSRLVSAFTPGFTVTKDQFQLTYSKTLNQLGLWISKFGI